MIFIYWNKATVGESINTIKHVESHTVKAWYNFVKLEKNESIITGDIKLSQYPLHKNSTNNLS